MRVLLVGHGRWGSMLASRLVSMPGMTLLVCDKDVSRIPASSTGVGPDMSWAIEHQNPDAVVIATPPDTHFNLAWEALARGAHVLVEKPMAMKTTEAAELIELAIKKQRTLMVDDTWQYHNIVCHILDMWKNKNPAIANAVWMNPRDQVTPEGILWTQGPHPVSLLLSRKLPTSSKLTSLYPSYAHLSEDGRYLSIRTNLGDTITMSWATEERHRFFSIAGREEFSYFDDRIHSSVGEPLTVMLTFFVMRCTSSEPWVDHHGLRVVSFLEQTQELLKR